ncbi:GNAT family N-acetyltransferase [Methanocella arvoryzae]|uniref:Acetyltransferase (GNAT family) n=1 Tax=Methanocella arvoryzae (strain DSM 22066 / NBRC 105507 / MRE50) TaxID=351160 RepID=Q0W7B6_METAR|nr:GNAT family N-acetyltransferase [Methanocella arvoryzae]CAH04774.1 n-terminal acetyltransferase complex, subunit Ard1 [uncultured archaeon]CAJ35727.1 putative acetyltransferase (GNAT family) [Methanocella arvoryzae MRE50]
MRIGIRHLERKLIVYGTISAALAALVLSPAYAGIDWMHVGIILLMVVAAGLATYVLFDRAAILLLRAKPAGEADEPRLYRITRKICSKAGIPAPRIAMLRGPAFQAFVLGMTKGRTVLFITRGLQERLDDEELEVVLGHELSHVEEMGLLPYNAVMLGISMLQAAGKRLTGVFAPGIVVYAEVLRNGPVTVGKASPSDVPAALKLLVRHGMYSVVYLNDLSRLARSGSPLFLAARYDGKPAGFLIGEIIMGRSGNTGHILKIVVDGNYRRKGIGDSLMQTFADTVAKAGCKSCYIEVRTDNAGAISLYRKHDYREKTIVPHYYPDGTGCQIMVKAL